MKIRYSERVLTDFPVIFAGDAFVGEGVVNNVSVPGCEIISNKPVEPGTYLEMKLMMPDNGPSLSVGLAKSDGARDVALGWNLSGCPAAIRSGLDDL